MKKAIFSSLALLLSSIVFSQTQIGIKGGLNINDIDDNRYGNNTATRIGYHGGLLFHIHVQRKLAVQPELVFSSQGAKYTHPDFNGDLVTNYLNIPVLLQYMGSRGIRLETGPQVGFLLDAELKRNGNTVADLKRSMNEADFSWAFGLGFLSRSGLGADARFNLGLTDIFEQGGRQSKHRVWQIGLFYQFRP
ncbi:MAG TPA: porin family protein [Flavisolibacter sp.]|jgi:hypothetical protein|nr:porin family protein [Flavisolibacter sp.]